LKSSKRNFEERNASDKGFKELNDAIYYLFQYLSKFEHSRDLNKEFQPIPIANKEDAYLAYLLSLAYFNLMEKKISK